ncbi:MAG: AAA family ATPase, partial [bacterium]|nr:AAA family ATPase [bacterium]
FYSVVLAGVHDVKSLKLKLGPGDEEKYNSPWNIASDFTIDMSLSPREIESMLIDYTAENKVKMDIKAIAERLYFYTSGYPFLVSKLCYIIDRDLNEKKTQAWTDRDVENAVKLILKEDNTNFQSIIKNIENNKELYRFIQRIILDGESISYIISDPDISLGTTYGILKEYNETCRIHNKIYEQLLYNHFIMGGLREKNVEKSSYYNTADNFLLDQNILDFKKVLLKFQ